VPKCVFMKDRQTKTICKKISVFTFGIFVISLLSQMYISNTTALKGKAFQHLNDEKARLDKELALLKYEDSKLSSLEYVEEKALQMGFVNMTEPLLSISSPALASLSTQ